jgi:hypothetical protein
LSRRIRCFSGGVPPRQGVEEPSCRHEPLPLREVRSVSQIHSVDEAPRRVVVESCAARFADEKVWALVCSRHGEQGGAAVLKLRAADEKVWALVCSRHGEQGGAAVLKLRVPGEKLWALACSRHGGQECSAVLKPRDSREPGSAFRRGGPLPPRAR